MKILYATAAFTMSWGIFVFGVASWTAWAAQVVVDFPTDGAGTITGYTKTTDVLIPAKIGGKPVTAIAEGAFARRGLAGVTIPAGVTAIERGAFSGNPLTRVTIPGGVDTGSDVVMPPYDNVLPPYGDDAAWDGFTEFYNWNGKLAGVYTRSGSKGAWAYSER